MQNDLARLRSEAERCRRLADNVTQRSDRETLRQMALELDAAAERLRARNEECRLGPGRSVI